MGYRGKNILIDHAYNFKTSYSHLDQILVNEGDFVERGEIIGYMGSSGRVTGPHLHFETIFLGEKLNPIYFLRLNFPYLKFHNNLKLYFHTFDNLKETFLFL